VAVECHILKKDCHVVLRERVHAVCVYVGCLNSVYGGYGV